MQYLIIPDVHGRDFWKSYANVEYYDKIIFLGDYLDHYMDESDDEHDIEVFKNIIKLKEDNPDKVILLIGNHDCPYIWPDTYGKVLDYWCRHDYKNHDLIHKLFTDNYHLFTFSWECEHSEYGKVLFTHAGVTETFKNICGLESKKINDFFRNNIDMLAVVSFYRGGMDPSGSPVWADVREHITNPVTEVYQIFGHTYSRNPIITPHFAMLDDGKDCYELNDLMLYKL